MRLCSQVARFNGWERVTAKSIHQLRNLIDLLTDTIKQQCNRGHLRAVGICYDVLVQRPGQSEKSDAVCCSLEHISGEAIDVFMPYAKTPHGLEYGEIFSLLREPPVLLTARNTIAVDNGDYHSLSIATPHPLNRDLDRTRDFPQKTGLSIPSGTVTMRKVRLLSASDDLPLLATRNEILTGAGYDVISACTDEVLSLAGQADGVLLGIPFLWRSGHRLLYNFATDFQARQ